MNNSTLNVEKFDITTEEKEFIAKLEFENSSCSMIGVLKKSFVIAADSSKLADDRRLRGCITFAIGIIFGARESIEGLTDYRQMIVEILNYISDRNAGQDQN